MYRAIIFVMLATVWGCTGKSPSGIKKSNTNQIEAINFKVVKTYPHDTGSFTEGFLFHDNQLFESTGSPEGFHRQGQYLVRLI